MSTCFSENLHFGNSERVAIKHYLQVTDTQFSEAAGVARMQLSQVVALLIQRWDELDHVIKTEIAVLLSSNEHLIPGKLHQTGAEQRYGTTVIVDTVTTLIGDVTSKSFPDDQVIQRFNQP